MVAGGTAAGGAVAGGTVAGAPGSQGGVPSGTSADSTISRYTAAPVVIDIGVASTYMSLHAVFDTSRYALSASDVLDSVWRAFFAVAAGV